MCHFWLLCNSVCIRHSHSHQGVYVLHSCDALQDYLILCKCENLLSNANINSVLAPQTGMMWSKGLSWNPQMIACMHSGTSLNKLSELGTIEKTNKNKNFGLNRFFYPCIYFRRKWPKNLGVPLMEKFHCTHMTLYRVISES